MLIIQIILSNFILLCRKQKHYHTLLISPSKIHNEDSGYDNRYPKNYSEPLLIATIKQHFQKKQWLHTLTNNKVSINDKLNLISLMSFYNNNSKAEKWYNGLEDF